MSKKEVKMKKIILFLILVLFSPKSDAACSLPPDGAFKPQCQIAEGTFKNGEVVYKQSYCKGDFPYCETFSGDCCSDPSYRTDGGWGCCNPKEYVAHRAVSISPGGKKLLNVGGYKCCSIAEYGKNSTYYFDKEEHVHCCGGKVYQAKSTSDEKSCCNPDFDSEGNIKHYYTVVSVMGAPEGETNQVCCKAIGNDPGEYRATAYWNGSSAQCCDGNTYKMGTDGNGNSTYGCCTGSKGSNKTHKVVSSAKAPNGEQGCCFRGEDGSIPKGYWTGYTVGCCLKGTVVSVLDAPNKEEACCSTETYGLNPSAYWDGSSVQCCKGEAKKKDDGTYICCPIPDSCSEGAEPVDNYVNGIGLCGKVCCTKEKENEVVNGISYSGYTVAVAVGNSCCGGYTSESWTWTTLRDDLNEKGELIWIPVSCSGSVSHSYSIKENGGVSYCAHEKSESSECGGTGDSYDYYYDGSDRYCFEWDYGSGGEGSCRCASVGDPAVGEYCDSWGW